ncbi:MAG: TatD family hydrolase [Pyrinomonadaceae bacterium]
MQNLIDSHCHIDGEMFEPDRSEVIRNALAAGVELMLNVGTGGKDSGSFEETLKLATENACVFGAVGVHPHDAIEYDEVFETRLERIISSSSKMIAWGEIGLDYFYEHSPRDIQKDVFRRQIKAARKADVPFIVHSRDSDSDTLEILLEECSYQGFRGGIMHCFAGTPEIARKLINIGFLISFAGNVTFKKAENLRESAKSVPLDKMLVETDCPYLTPVPFRGKRNEPARVVETASFLAELKGVSFQELANTTTRNFKRFFRL